MRCLPTYGRPDAPTHPHSDGVSPSNASSHAQADGKPHGAPKPCPVCESDRDTERVAFGVPHSANPASNSPVCRRV